MTFALLNNPVRTLRGLWSSSLKTRVAVSIFLLFAAGIWLLALWAMHALQVDLRQLLGAQQYASASLIAQGLEQERADREKTIREMASILAVRMDRGAPAVQQILESSPALRLMFSGGVLVSDSLGGLIGHTGDQGWLGTNLMDRDYVRAALLERRTSLGRPARDEVLKTAVLGMATPILDAQDRVLGAVVGLIDLEKSGFFHRLGLSAASGVEYLVVSGKERLIVAASDPAKVLQPLGLPGVDPDVEAFMLGREGFDIVTHPSGQAVLAAAKAIGSTGWHVVSHIPTEQLFAPIRQLRRSILLTALLVISLAGAGVWRLLRWQLRPLEEAAVEVHRLVQTGGHGELLTVRSTDEIGQLLADFSSLRQTLKQREQALEASELRWRFAIEGAGDGVWDWDIECGAIFLSPRGRQIIGVPVQTETLSLALLQRSVHPADRAEVMQVLQDHLAGRSEVYAHKYRIQVGDGLSPCWVLARGLVVEREANGRARRMIGTLTDVTQPTLNEQALVDARQQAEQASQAKSRFLASMNHEFRTPLNAVLGLASLLEIDSGLDAEQRSQAKMIAEAGIRLLHLVRDLLDLARIEAGALALSLRAVSLQQVVAESVQLVQAMAQSAGVTLVNALEQEVDTVVEADQRHLQQVVVNLLSNGIKYNRPGGRVLVSCERVTLAEGRRARFFVTDTGRGIPIEMQSRVFGAFDRLGRESGAVAGAGIGLQMSRQLVEAMGGRISFVSQPALGSSFCVDFPLGEP